MTRVSKGGDAKRGDKEVRVVGVAVRKDLSGRWFPLSFRCLLPFNQNCVYQYFFLFKGKLLFLELLMFSWFV